MLNNVEQCWTTVLHGMDLNYKIVTVPGSRAVSNRSQVGSRGVGSKRAGGGGRGPWQSTEVMAVKKSTFSKQFKAFQWKPARLVGFSRRTWCRFCQRQMHNGKQFMWNDVLKLRCLTTMPGSYSQYMLHVDSIWIMLINHDRPMVCRNRKNDEACCVCLYMSLPFTCPGFTRLAGRAARRSSGGAGMRWIWKFCDVLCYFMASIW